MTPRVRRVRRWSFVLTVPIAVVIARVYGVHQGALVIAVRAALWAAVAVAAWRLGGERGDALRDLLTHPRVRAFARGELDILTALPRLVIARAGTRRQPGASYHHGTFGFALALAWTPIVVSEDAVLALLVGGGLVAWVLTALHAYMLIWLWGLALGPRAYPHRIGARTAVLRGGPMYRVQVPLTAITKATARTERVGEGQLTQRDGAVLVAARGRVDVWLEFDRPVRVQRPLHEPLSTSRLAIASDEPDQLIERLLDPSPASPARRGRGVEGGLALLAGLELASLARDAAQPG
jgi:hypothetical protein